MGHVAARRTAAHLGDSAYVERVDAVEALLEAYSEVAEEPGDRRAVIAVAGGCDQSRYGAAVDAILGPARFRPR